ncbi:hypothetical protein PAPHI01_1043 [Pancytospora philotis]|nr:hypothetical protein PAPHI01_1043 [Pancytospora philotis]
MQCPDPYQPVGDTEFDCKELLFGPYVHSNRRTTNDYYPKDAENGRFLWTNFFTFCKDTERYSGQREQSPTFKLEDYADGLGKLFANPPQLGSQPAPPICHAPTKAVGYRPQAVRGTGAEREGYCVRCDQWFRLKTSSYWYHMNYKHGISAGGQVCPEPKLRTVGSRREGYCKECKAWVPFGKSSKCTRFGWFRHWQKNHSKSNTL